MESLVGLVLRRITRISDELGIRGARVIVLNDLVINLWGLIKPISENRLLVRHDDTWEVADIVSTLLGLPAYKADIYKSLEQAGIAIVNPITIPLIIIELPRTTLDMEVIDKAASFKTRYGKINVPRLEELIVKMLSIGKYPYTMYAYTLLIGYADILNTNRFKQLCEKSNINTERIRKVLSYYTKLASIFPELRSNIEEIRVLIKKL